MIRLRGRVTNSMRSDLLTPQIPCGRLRFKKSASSFVYQTFVFLRYFLFSKLIIYTKLMFW